MQNINSKVYVNGIGIEVYISKQQAEDMGLQAACKYLAHVSKDTSESDYPIPELRNINIDNLCWAIDKLSKDDSGRFVHVLRKVESKQPVWFGKKFTRTIYEMLNDCEDTHSRWCIIDGDLCGVSWDNDWDGYCVDCYHYRDNKWRKADHSWDGVS